MSHTANFGSDDFFFSIYFTHKQNVFRFYKISTLIFTFKVNFEIILIPTDVCTFQIAQNYDQSLTSDYLDFDEKIDNYENDSVRRQPGHHSIVLVCLILRNYKYQVYAVCCVFKLMCLNVLVRNTIDARLCELNTLTIDMMRIVNRITTIYHCVQLWTVDM